MIFNIIFLISGITLLYFGAEGLVNGSSRIALRLGIKPVIVGLTIAAFGTSAPELVVSVNAALKNMGDISAGNIIGSNIFNIAVILGIASCIYPITVQKQLLRQDVPVMIGASILCIIFLADKHISRIEGLFLFALFFAYIIRLIVSARKEPQQSSQFQNGKKGNTVLDCLYIMIGLAGLIFGARLFIQGAIEIARFLKVPQAIIGLTIIASGTSLPELATSTVAAFKKENDIAIGNIIGSNIFNILAIMGITGLIYPIRIEGIHQTDILVMVGLSLIVLPFMWTGFKLSRVEGVFLLLIYVVYTICLSQRIRLV